MPMHHPDLNRIMHHSHTRRERRLVIIAFDDMHVGRDRPQILVRLLVADVARAEDLLDLARDEEFLEL